MIRKYLLPALAILGAVFAVYSVIVGSKPMPVAPPVAQPAQAPFNSYIAGAGIIEASTENISVGTSISGIIAKVYLKAGSSVKSGDPLFTLDDRELRAELAIRQANLQNAEDKLARLQSLPRLEDIPPAEARVKEAETSLSDSQNHLALAESVTDKRAVSMDDLNHRRYAVQLAEAKLSEMKAQLELLKAGPWKPDIDIAKTEVASAQAYVRATETNIERLTVRSPVNGEVLQLNVREGEYAQTGALQKPLILIGNLDRLHIRVDIDENDAWRFRKDSQAIAFVRGNREMKTLLRYESTEPYVIPKRSLTGDSNERVDTRVMQAVYSFDRVQLPLYAGQQMDVFIEVQPAGANPPAHTVNNNKAKDKADRGKK